ncbi:pathogenesis-related homeodomain protein-like [Gastrolobium bilobum]|uniref:pathogenesis-related homeodomain protein-like n=1 Tax=Gastrolobium bilobum TaxID=150636 RepID=UPI002AB0184E|nr:pathogenesis-related homeodomain protein-like [Gastrolobium bilobum]
MRDSKKKLGNGESKKSGYSKARTKFQGKKHKSESKSHTHSVGTNISRKRATDCTLKGPRKDSSNKKSRTGQNFQQTDRKSSQKPLSKLQGKKVSLSSRKEGKVVDGEVKLQKRKRKKKRQRNNVDLDDASRLQRRTRYLLIKMKLEQNLIDAYSGEGWKGQSREKIRPEKELQRARKQILKYKLSIRDAIRQLDSLSSLSSIPVIAPDGSVNHEHVFCAKCKLRESLPDNDIILCHGTCNCAFHQECLDPPLDTENIPHGDHGWFCKFCECKMEILEAMNAHLGTHFSLHSTWQDVFKEEAAIPDGDTGLLNPEEEWPSDDSEDDDYNPERGEDSHNINTKGTDDNASDDLSSSTSLCSSDGECSPVYEGVNHEYCSVNSSIDSDESEEKACGRRQRKAVDYKKLYDEMFGKDAPAYEQMSEDEDWGPGKSKRREKESDAVNTLMTLHESKNKYPNKEHSDRTRKDSSGINIKRSCHRIPRDAVEKLRQVFAENELPPRSMKEDLSKELGLDIEKVSKWFKNARYIALKTRKLHAEGEDQLQSIITSRKNSTLQNPEKANILKSNTSKITTTHSQKNVRNVTGRKKRKSPSSPFKERQPEIPPPHPIENGNKDFMEMSDDVSLKKLLKERKRRVNFTFEGNSQAAELEFERLSKLKIKLDSMKQKLTGIQNYRVKGLDIPHSNEPSIIYVPTAVLKEKV